MYSPYDVRNAYPSRHTKAEGKFTPQICRSRIFVPANECTRVVPMYPSQSAMSHLHSLAQSMYIATFLPKHVIPSCFADYVTSTSGAIRLAFNFSPWPQVRLRLVVALWHAVSVAYFAAALFHSYYLIVLLVLLSYCLLSLREGFATFKGRPLYPHQVPSRIKQIIQSKQPVPKPCKTSVPALPLRPPGHLRAFQWNASRSLDYQTWVH